jgi:hypothetical protein
MTFICWPQHQGIFVISTVYPARPGTVFNNHPSWTVLKNKSHIWKLWQDGWLIKPLWSKCYRKRIDLNEKFCRYFRKFKFLFVTALSEYVVNLEQKVSDLRTQQGNLLHDVTNQTTVTKDLDDNIKNTAKEMTTLIITVKQQAAKSIS